MKIQIKLLEPYPLQAEILASPAKYKAICAGRRAGKTTLAALAAADAFTHGQKVLIASATQDQTDVFWALCRKWFAPLMDVGLVEKNEVKRTLTFKQSKGKEGIIRCKTGSDPDILRGDYADLLILDETASLNERIWSEVGRPMLLDTDGKAMFIGTPRRKNWFYRLYQHADNPAQREWSAWHFPTMANPFIKSNAFSQLIHEMPDSVYRQEILAEFVEGEGAVFRNIRSIANIAQRPTPYFNPMVMGVDWGQANDFTVCAVLDASRREMVALDRYNNLSWQVQKERLMTLAYNWKVQHIVAEANSMGSPIIEDLQRAGLPIYPFTTTAQSKEVIINSLMLAFENQDVRLFDDPALISEFEAFECRINPYTGHARYAAPDGNHDDIVIATVLALHACSFGVNVFRDIKLSANEYYEDLASLLG